MRFGYTENQNKDQMLLGPSEYHAETGFLENFQAAVGMTMLNDLSWSGAFWHDHEEERRKKVYGLIQDGKVDWQYIDQFRDERGGLDFDAVSRSLREDLGIDDIPTRQEILKKNKIQEDALLGYGRDISANASLGGKIGGFLGTLPAYALDPMFTASMLIPVGQAARSAHWLTRAAMAGGKTALAEGALEAVRQPMIYGWRTQMGLDYSIKEGLEQVAFAIGGAGILGSVAEMASGIGRYLSHVGKDNAIARKNLEDLKFLLESAPDPDMPAHVHLENLRGAIDDFNAYPKGAMLKAEADNIPMAEAKAKPMGEPSARAETSEGISDLARSENAMYAEHIAKEADRLLRDMPEEILELSPKEITAAIDIVESGGKLTTKVRPLQQAVEEMEEVNTAFQKASDCLFG